MKKVKQAAQLANGRSRRCAKCPFCTRPKSRCTEEIWNLCHDSFIEGFEKGAKWQKSNNNNQSK